MNFPKFIKNNPEVESYLNKLLTENPNWENIRNIVYGICFDEELKKCKNCGKEMKYSQGNNGYCSYKCSRNSNEVQEKVKQTCLKKYSCEYPNQCKEIKEKSKQTNLERYGCENPLQNKEIREKIKQTCKERYNIENPFQSKKIKEKIKETCLEKYGCKYPMQSKSIKEKAKQTYKQTCLEKYGCENVFQNKEIKEKIKETCLERFNCENPSQNKEVQDKIKQTCLERYGVKYILQNEKFKRARHDNSYDNFILSFVKYGITPLFPKEEYNGWDKIYKWKCLICQNEFEQKIHTTGHVEECPYLPHCWKCYPRLSGESKAELELFNFIKEFAPNVRQHDKTIIGPYELDVVIDELKLAIEFNGDYWHSTKHYLEKYGNLDEYYGYHLNKTIEANKKGYRLIHISESEWINNQEEIKKKLIDIFEGKENLNFIEDKIKLDRSWYNNIEIPGYKLVEELPPEMINRNGFNIENCGYLIYEKIK